MAGKFEGITKTFIKLVTNEMIEKKKFHQKMLFFTTLKDKYIQNYRYS